MNTLEEYKQKAKPRFYEWLPIFSILYEIRLSQYVHWLSPVDPVKQEIVKTFREVSTKSFGLVLLAILITPLVQVITSKKVIKKLSA